MLADSENHKDQKDSMPRSMKTPTASEAVPGTQLKPRSQLQWGPPPASRAEPVAQTVVSEAPSHVESRNTEGCQYDQRRSHSCSVPISPARVDPSAARSNG